MNLRRGTWGRISNVIVQGSGVETIDVRDQATVSGTNENPVALFVDNSIFFDIRANDTTYFVAEPSRADRRYGG
jgi:hypothetical protein